MRPRPQRRPPDLAEAGPRSRPRRRPAPAAKPVAPAELDRLLAPVALYPDSLLAQILQCAQKPWKGGCAGRVDGRPAGAQGQRAAGCRGEVGLRAELRGARRVPGRRQRHGEPDRSDDEGRPGLHRGSQRRLRQRPAPAGEGEERRDAEDHPAAGGLDPGDVDGRGHRHRAGQPGRRLRAAIQPGSRLHPARLHDRRDPGRGRRRLCRGRGRRDDRVHGRRRDRRRRQQQLLLRRLRLSRRL